MTDVPPADAKAAQPPLTAKQKFQGCAMLLVLALIVVGVGVWWVVKPRQVPWAHIQATLPHLAKPPMDEKPNEDGNLVRRWNYTGGRFPETILAVIFTDEAATRVKQANIIVREAPGDMPTALDGSANLLLLVKAFATSPVDDHAMSAWYAENRHNEGAVRSFGGAMVVIKQVQRSGGVTRTLCAVN